MNIQEILEDQHCFLRQERQERHLLLSHRQFWYNAHLLQLVFRQLRLHLKGTDGVDIVTKQVDTEWQLIAEAVNIEDAATQGKLARFIDIVYLQKSQVAQLPCRFVSIYRFTHAKHHRPLVQLFLRNNEFGNGLWVSDDKPTPNPSQREGSLSRKFRQHLGAKNLVGTVALSILDGTTIAGGEEEHLLFA